MVSYILCIWLVKLSLQKSLVQQSFQLAKIILQVASGKLRKDKDGNWEFEYDSQSGSEEPEDVSIVEDLVVHQQPNDGGVPTFNLLLRVRNQQRILNDIKFDFSPSNDTGKKVSILGHLVLVDSIAHELVSADLIDCRDIVIVAANLQKIIKLAEEKSDKKSVTFALNSGVATNEVTFILQHLY